MFLPLRENVLLEQPGASLEPSWESHRPSWRRSSRLPGQLQLRAPVALLDYFKDETFEAGAVACYCYPAIRGHQHGFPARFRVFRL